MKDELIVRFGKRDEPPIAISSATLLSENDDQPLVHSVNLDDHTACLYLAEVPSGRYWLCAKIEAHPVLQFAIEIKGEADKTVSFVGRAPRCASIVVEFVRRNEAKWHVHTMTIGMAPKHSAVVLVAGFDYHSGQAKPTDYSVFARQWRDDLYYGTTDEGPQPNRKIDRAIFEHTVVTTFNFATGYACEQIRGVKGWHTMHEFMCGTEPPHTTNPDTDVNLRKSTDSISIVHIYAYIDKLGRDAPEALAQLHFFSHGFSRGPVLMNTYDDVGNGVADRDPGDKDPRYKDFLDANIKKHWPHLPQAFSPAGLVKSWGCLTDNGLRDRINAVLHATSSSEQIEYKGEMISRDSVMKNARKVLYASYVMAFVHRFNLNVWGAAPGTSAGYGEGHHMHVEQDVYGAMLRWYEKCFGGNRDLSGYFPYARLQSSPEDEP